MTTPTSSGATLLRSLFAGLLLALAACGGGVETGGTGAGAYVQGPISGFGSVIVAGIRFDDSTAAVEDTDGDVRRRDDLRLGMLVEVESGAVTADGSGGRVATATRIRVGSELVGPLTAIDAAASRLVVLGQAVRLPPATVVSGIAAGVTGLVTGDLLKVYGFFDPAGTYVATRVERLAAAPANYRVRGVVQDLDAAARTLRIGTQTFDLGASGVPAGLANGQFVRLTLQTAQTGGSWPVTRVAIETLSVGDRDDAEVEGLINAFSSTVAFSVNGVRIDGSQASVSNGSLALGARVKVRGRSQAGLLVATTVEIRSDGDVLSEGFDIRDTIASIDIPSQTFVLRGISIYYGSVPAPRFDNGVAADLAAGRAVRVRGTLAGDRTRVVATRIEFVNN
jgi:Domain of unknown function (DUF5666)